MDLRKLRYFVGVAEAGGFRRAARRLHVAQPALSKQIRELEAEVGTRLLERGSLGVSLTPEGHRLLAESREIIERIENLPVTIAKPNGPVRGCVGIGAPSAVAGFLFGPLAHRLHRRHPEIHLKFISDTSRVIELLEADQLELGIVTLVEPDEIGGTWHVDKLVREQDYLVGPKGTLDPSRAVDFAFVLDRPLVLTPMPHSRRGHMERLAAASGRALNVAAEAGAIGAQVSFVCQGLGFAVMPLSAANLMKAAGPIDIVPIRGLRSWRLLVRRGDRRPSRPSLVVSSTILELFRDGLPYVDTSLPTAPLETLVPG